MDRQDVQKCAQASDPDPIANLRQSLREVLTARQINDTILDQHVVAAMKTKLWILDPAAGSPDDLGLEFETRAHQKQKMMKKVFAELCDADVTDVEITEETKAKAVLHYFEANLADVAEDEVLFVYFCGGAGHNGKNYKWKFTGNFKKKINADEVIRFCVNSRKNVFFLLDCYMPSRYHNKWTVPTFDKPTAIEILSCGERLQDTDGSSIDNADADFTINVLKGLKNLVKNINVDGGKFGRAGWHKPRTIPQLLAKHDCMSSNPQTQKLPNTSPGTNGYFSHVVMLPDHIRATGKIQFFLRQIQDPCLQLVRKSLFVMQDEPEQDEDDEV